MPISHNFQKNADKKTLIHMWNNYWNRMNKKIKLMTNFNLFGGLFGKDFNKIMENVMKQNEMFFNTHNSYKVIYSNNLDNNKPTFEKYDLVEKNEDDFNVKTYSKTDENGVETIIIIKTPLQKKMTVEELEILKTKAIEKEDFETASKLRDQINELKKKE